MTGVSPNLSAKAPPVFLPAAEAALAILTLTTAAGFWRVFDSGAFLPPMAAVAIISHLILMVCRRRGWGVLVAAALSAPVAALTIVWLVFPETTTMGVPTADTIETLLASLSDSWRQFRNILAPAPPEPGFVVASSVALYFTAFLADWAAFRLWSSFEAVVPASTLFVFCSLLQGPDSNYKIIAAAGYLAAVLLFLLLHRAARQESTTGWLLGDDGQTGRASPSGRGAPMLVGATLATMAVLVGSVIGPRLPGAGSAPVLSWRSTTNAQGERKAVSPLVRIRDRLLQQPDMPMFTVQANRPTYWRLTSLETFDGEIWRSQGRFGSAEGDLPGEGAESETDLLIQRFSIENLTDIWAPAAYRPVKVVDSKIRLGYNEDSSTLIVDSNATLEGSTYTIQSRHTQPTAEQLRTVTDDDVPEEIWTRYGGLPDDFSELARRTALEQTRGRDNPYDKARALQDFFRSTGQFTYDTTFEGGHSESAIDAFLKGKRGFCEQFAGTFAAMARSIGLPSRVAVGFTHGVTKNPNVPNVYQVSARQTHAWPEVYLGRFGWVMFEPTPGRGAPNAEPWTGVREEQDTGGPPPPATVPNSAPLATAPLNVNPAPPTSFEPETPPPTTAPEPDRTPTVETRREWYWEWLLVVAPAGAGLAVVLLCLMLLAAGYLGVATLVLRRRRAERLAKATDDSRRVLVAWHDCLEALQPLRLVPAHTESHDEFARRVAPRLTSAGPDLLALAALVDHADYAHDLLDEHAVRRAAGLTSSVVSAAERLTTPVQRWLHRFDPRSLSRDGRRKPQHTISM
jgi:transglutaminase-like putative cysteine protease